MAKYVEFRRGNRRLFINPELVTGFSTSATNQLETVIYTGEKDKFYAVEHDIDTVKKLLESVNN
ncbi:hypothetical protein MUGA111182_05890 [Mucilaginibacter galii]|uniref:Uncharacterized protein n=1 Tax=Mucilaginibacter galii TaxID=2005073 RepID=A0A917J9P8_9SPHI|nr:hypothetical protein [Mucilaginibacter galii]GGI49991.1 hypothetical protein GCM10011425_12030 [Mucilaginibacter galii]